jgi:hypothetical protein
MNKCKVEDILRSKRGGIEFTVMGVMKDSIRCIDKDYAYHSFHKSQLHKFDVVVDPLPFLCTEEALEIRKKLGEWAFGEEWEIADDTSFWKIHNYSGKILENFDFIGIAIMLTNIHDLKDHLTHDFLFSVLEKLIKEPDLGYNIMSDCGDHAVWVGNKDSDLQFGQQCNNLIEALARCLSECIDYLEANDDKVPS